MRIQWSKTLKEGIEIRLLFCFFFKSLVKDNFEESLTFLVEFSIGGLELKVLSTVLSNLKHSGIRSSKNRLHLV